MSEEKEPKHLSTLRIIGFSLLAIGIMLMIFGLAARGTSTHYALFVPGMFASLFGCSLIFTGYSAKIAKMKIASEKYIKRSSKEDLKDIADTTASVASDAVTTTVKAVKRGLKDTKFCSECGTEIEADSKFCKNCGKEQK